MELSRSPVRFLSTVNQLAFTPSAIISNVARVPGRFIGTGFSGHGFGIGPGAGKLMADIVHNDEPLVDTHAFRLSRFSDGTKITIDAGF